MLEKFSIREADLSHVSEIVKLWVDFMKEHEKTVVGKNPRLKHYEKKDSKMAYGYTEFAKSKIESADGKIFIAECSGKIIGYVMVFIKTKYLFLRTKEPASSAIYS